MKYKIDQIFVYPTDTVWGIGCNIHSEKGFLEIAKIKQTSNEKPLSILFTSKEILNLYLNLNKLDQTLLRKIEEVFSLEATVLFPVSLCTEVFPKYLTSLSPFLSVRFLTDQSLAQLVLDVGAPIFTTSLNKTGNPPIINEQDALEFKNSFCPNAILIKSNLSEKMSGQSSTIIKLDQSFSVVRPGNNIEAIRRLLL